MTPRKSIQAADFKEIEQRDETVMRACGGEITFAGLADRDRHLLLAELERLRDRLHSAEVVIGRRKSTTLNDALALGSEYLKAFNNGYAAGHHDAEFDAADELARLSEIERLARYLWSEADVEVAQLAAADGGKIRDAFREGDPLREDLDNALELREATHSADQSKAESLRLGDRVEHDLATSEGRNFWARYAVLIGDRFDQLIDDLAAIEAGSADLVLETLRGRVAGLHGILNPLADLEAEPSDHQVISRQAVFSEIKKLQDRSSHE